MTIKENIGIALNSIRGNALRAVITALIISLGIMALVGILTAIDGIKASINSNFSSMGANTFNIKNKGQNIHFSGKNKQQKTEQHNEITKQNKWIINQELKKDINKTKQNQQIGKTNIKYNKEDQTVKTWNKKHTI